MGEGLDVELVRGAERRGTGDSLELSHVAGACGVLGQSTVHVPHELAYVGFDVALDEEPVAVGRLDVVCDLVLRDGSIGGQDGQRGPEHRELVLLLVARHVHELCLEVVVAWSSVGEAEEVAKVFARRVAVEVACRDDRGCNESAVFIPTLQRVRV